MISEKVALIAMVGLGVALAGQTWRLKSEQSDHLQTQLVYSRADVERERVAGAAQREYNDKAQQDRERAQKANDDAKQKIESLAGKLAAAGTERERLRAAYAAALNRSCEASAPGTPAGPSQAASAAGSVLADVPGRLDEASSRIAEFAERAMTAAEACAAAW